MNDTPLQSTLREMRSLAKDVRSWTVLTVLSLVTGLVGPFGSFDMAVVPRLLYWTAIVFGTSAIGTLVASFAERLLRRRLPWFAAALIGGVVAGVPIALAVAAVNVVAFGPGVQPIDVLVLTGYCALIAAAVTVLGAVFRELTPRPTASEGETPASPALLERLPLPQRGKLLHIAVADHYVEVTTDRGKALILMRLSDAVRETAPVGGLQVHRSHWIALDAVTRVARQAGKPVLELSTGATVPVSRTYLSAARAAGLAL